MDNLTINRAQSPTFTAIKYQKGVLNSKKRKAVVEYISGKLNEVDPSDKAGRSYVQRAESFGYDILFTKANNGKAVRTDVVSTLAQKQAAVWNGIPISPITHVGTYKKPEQFDIQHFNNTYKSQEKTTKHIGCFLYGMLATFIAIGLFAMGGIVRQSFKPKKMNNIEMVAKDTAKVDSIKPVITDTIRAVKKVIKK